MGKDPRPISQGGQRDSDPAHLDDLRVVPTQCTEKERRAWIAQGQNFTGELTTTSDQRRVFRGNTFIGPAISLGNVASQAEMLLLGGTMEEPANRGVYQGDWCYRTDRGGSKWVCVAEYGLEIAHWREDPIPEVDSAISLEPVIEDGEIMTDSTEDDENGDILMEEAE